MNRKSSLTLEQVAADLITEAEENAKRYIQTFDPHSGYDLGYNPDHFCDRTTEAFVYAYILASLRRDFPDGLAYKYLRSTEGVGEAMKQRFGMSNEDFATDIIGG